MRVLFYIIYDKNCLIKIYPKCIITELYDNKIRTLFDFLDNNTAVYKQ